MTVAVCTIVKNEAALLPRCLASVDGLWDELIIVDTGSEDATVAIAEAHGATVLHYAWQYPGNKGAARQMGIDAATAEWIVVIDADEVLKDATQLRATLAESPDSAGAYNVLFRNYGDGDEVTLEWYQMRVFRRTAYRYIYREHEIPVACGDGSGDVLTIPILYEHRPPVGAAPGKVTPMLDRLILDVTEHPGDPHCLYMCARQHAHAGNYAEAIEMATQYLDAGHRGMASDVCRVAAICCNQAGNRRGMYEWMHRATAFEAHRRLLWVELAHMNWQDGKPLMAEALARMALELPLPATQREIQPVERDAHIVEMLQALKARRA